MVDIKEIMSKAMTLRINRKFQEAHAFVTQQSTLHEGLKGILWQHDPVFWSDIKAGICLLTRRNGDDAPFINELWDKPDFLHSFHRHAPKLPKRRQELVDILEREFVSTIGSACSLHWIVRDRKFAPWGVLSLVDLSLTHRRAEVMLGMMPNSPAGLSAAAMFVLFQFFFRIMKFNKLYSFVYDDNPRSLQGALHLGFVVEGRLRRHVVDPRTGDHLDLIQTGLLASDAFNPTTEKLMQRLLRPRALPGRSIGQ